MQVNREYVAMECDCEGEPRRHFNYLRETGGFVIVFDDGTVARMSEESANRIMATLVIQWDTRYD